MKQQPRVLLAKLKVSTSNSGRVFYTGWLGASQVLGWPGPKDKHGNPTVELYLQPRKEQPDERCERELEMAEP